VNRISIDAALTRGIGEVAWKQRAIDAVIALASSLGIEVVVQGLESAAQVDYLRRHPKLLAQGFLLEPPLEAEQCWELIQRHAEIGSSIRRSRPPGRRSIR
jgi:EAL domain-containing protein (putative c-di-GMP-specific phosphodiesterase class I)